MLTFPLEKLSPELILMVMEQVVALDKVLDNAPKLDTGEGEGESEGWHGNKPPPMRCFQSLISASPTCLRLYNTSSKLTITRLSALARWKLTSPAAYQQVMNASRLRARLGEMGQGQSEVEREQRVQIVRHHVDQALSLNELANDPVLYGRLKHDSSLYYEPDHATIQGCRGGDDPNSFGQKMALLTDVLDLAAILRRHARLVNLFNRRPRPIYPGCTPSSRTGLTAQATWEQLLQFQVYCDSFFSAAQDDSVLTEEASRYRRAFFERMDERFRDMRGGWYHPSLYSSNLRHEHFYLVLHYVFEKHKTIVRQAACDLGVIEYPGGVIPGFWGQVVGEGYSASWKESVRRNKNARKPTATLELNTTTRGLQILDLHKRTLALEDGYCRYKMSFGLELVDRLLMRMSREERCVYTLEEFSWFVGVQEPRACYLENTALSIDGWAPNGTPSGPLAPEGYVRWEGGPDQSRTTYTAWFWELAHRSHVGTNITK